jgi:hypothetical protein
MKISKEAAQKIVATINTMLVEQGLDGIPQARSLATQLASNVKRIVLKDLESQQNA